MELMKTTLLIVAVALCWTGTSLANPYPEPLPRPIRTEEELVAAVGAGGPRMVEAIHQVAMLGPEHAWILADLAERDDLSIFTSTVFKGLARIGDAQSIQVLRDVVSDTSRPWHVRVEASSALVAARDVESAALLRDVAATAPDSFWRNLLETDARRIESPRLFRDLFVYRKGFIDLGFLLDDIESITCSESHGRRTYQFPESEHRQVCELLQTGVGVDDSPLVSGMSYKLTFVLADGATGTLETDGVVFEGVKGSLIKCLELGQLMKERLRESGELPN